MTTLSFISVPQFAALARTVLQLDELAHEAALESIAPPSNILSDDRQQRAELARELYLSLTRAAMQLVGKNVPPTLFQDASSCDATDTVDQNLARMITALIGIDARPRPAVIEVNHVLALIKQAEHTLRTLQRRVNPPLAPISSGASAPGTRATALACHY